MFVYPGALSDSDASTACEPEAWAPSELRAHAEPVSSVALGLNGAVLVSASHDGTVALWDVNRSRLLGNLQVGAAGAGPTFAAVDENARRIVAATGETVFDFPVERETLRQRLCELAGRPLTPDERATFLPAEQYEGVGRCGAS